MAETIQQIESGVQRQPDEPTRSGKQAFQSAAEHWSQRLGELHAMAHIQERPFASDIPIIGRLIVLVREMWNSVAAKWYVRPMVHQQVLFNQRVVVMVQGLLETNVGLYQRLHETNQQLEQTNQQLEQVEARLMSADRDVTCLARYAADAQYRTRQKEHQAAKERSTLARRLAEHKDALAALDSRSTVEGRTVVE